jgi:hypothetical protein
MSETREETTAQVLTQHEDGTENGQQREPELKGESPMPDAEFSYSTDGGEYYMGSFATREEALAEAREDVPYRKVWTGIQVPFDVAVDAGTVIEDLRNRADDHAGDVSEDWLSRVTAHERDELCAALTVAFVVWMTKYGHAPTFYGIADEEIFDPASTPTERPTA